MVNICGAGDGTRTRDNLLGRQGLCQLSYSRKVKTILAQISTPVKGKPLSLFLFDPLNYLSLPQLAIAHECQS